MDIIINEKLKELRKSKGNTQEELAEFLGISIQAISKWERSEGYPDITLLPKIAAYYNVTVDDLLGMGESRQQQRINQIFFEKEKNNYSGNTEANIILFRNAIKEFPNNFRIIQGLMDALYICGKTEYLNEVIQLGERILKGCNDDQIRYNALQLLCYSLPEAGNYEKAKEYANKLPDMNVTSNSVLNSILKGDELLAHTQSNLRMLVDDIWLNVIHMFRAKDFTEEEKIHALQTVLKFFGLLYEDDDCGFFHCHIEFIYRDIAVAYAKLENIEKTIENLTLSAKHAIIFDNMEDHRLTSPLVNMTEYKKSDFSKNYSETETQLVLKSLSWEYFDLCRNDERFINLKNELM